MTNYKNAPNTLLNVTKYLPHRTFYPCFHFGSIGYYRKKMKISTLSAKLIIYKSSILPHLTYCHLVWHNCRSSDSRKIERIQERALRAVFNSHSESYENLLVRADLPSQLNRRLPDIAILMYKVKYGLAPRKALVIH